MELVYVTTWYHYQKNAIMESCLTPRNMPDHMQSDMGYLRTVREITWWNHGMTHGRQLTRNMEYGGYGFKWRVFAWFCNALVGLEVPPRTLSVCAVTASAYHVVWVLDLACNMEQERVLNQSRLIPSLRYVGILWIIVIVADQGRTPMA